MQNFQRQQQPYRGGNPNNPHYGGYDNGQMFQQQQAGRIEDYQRQQQQPMGRHPAGGESGQQNMQYFHDQYASQRGRQPAYPPQQYAQQRGNPIQGSGMQYTQGPTGIPQEGSLPGSVKMPGSNLPSSNPPMMSGQFSSMQQQARQNPRMPANQFYIQAQKPMTGKQGQMGFNSAQPPQSQPLSKKILKFIVDNPMAPQDQEIKKISWTRGSSSEQIMNEIYKVAGVQEAIYNIQLYDADDCVVVLNEEMDFQPIYKIKLRFHHQQQQPPGTPFSIGMSGGQNHSLVYSQTTTGGGSLFKSPMVGDSYNQYAGVRVNWPASSIGKRPTLQIQNQPMDIQQSPYVMGRNVDVPGPGYSLNVHENDGMRTQKILPRKCGLESDIDQLLNNPNRLKTVIEEEKVITTEDDRSYKSYQSGAKQNLHKYVGPGGTHPGASQGRPSLPMFGQTSKNDRGDKAANSQERYLPDRPNVNYDDEMGDNEFNLVDSFIDLDNKMSLLNANPRQSIIEHTMESRELKPFMFKKSQMGPFGGVQRQMVPPYMGADPGFNTARCQTAPNEDFGRNIDVGAQTHRRLDSQGDPAGFDPVFFQNLYSQIAESNRAISQKQSQVQITDENPYHPQTHESQERKKTEPDTAKKPVCDIQRMPSRSKISHMNQIIKRGDLNENKVVNELSAENLVDNSNADILNDFISDPSPQKDPESQKSDFKSIQHPNNTVEGLSMIKKEESNMVDQDDNYDQFIVEKAPSEEDMRVDLGDSDKKKDVLKFQKQSEQFSKKDMESKSSVMHESRPQQDSRRNSQKGSASIPNQAVAQPQPQAKEQQQQKPKPKPAPEPEETKSSPESIEKKDVKPSQLKRRNSFKIKESLLNHVKKGGFKEGFSNDDKKTNEAQSKAHAAQQMTEQKYNSPARMIDQLKKAAPPPVIEHNVVLEQEEGFQFFKQNPMALNIVNINGTIFPAYDSGKFYKNNEDVILKEKIERLEKEQKLTDPEGLAQQKKVEQHMVEKLKSLSPYQNPSTRRYVIDRQSRKVLGIYTDSAKGGQKGFQIVDPQLNMALPQEYMFKPTTPQLLKSNQFTGFMNSYTKYTQNKPMPDDQNTSPQKLVAPHTPQPRIDINRSPLGTIMKKIGLEIGVDTGHNLNKMIMKKPVSFANLDDIPKGPESTRKAIDNGFKFNSSGQEDSKEDSKPTKSPASKQNVPLETGSDHAVEKPKVIRLSLPQEEVKQSESPEKEEDDDDESPVHAAFTLNTGAKIKAQKMQDLTQEDAEIDKMKDPIDESHDELTEQSAKLKKAILASADVALDVKQHSFEIDAQAIDPMKTPQVSALQDIKREVKPINQIEIGLGVKEIPKEETTSLAPNQNPYTPVNRKSEDFGSKNYDFGKKSTQQTQQQQQQPVAAPSSGSGHRPVLDEFKTPIMKNRAGAERSLKQMKLTRKQEKGDSDQDFKSLLQSNVDLVESKEQEFGIGRKPQEGEEEEKSEGALMNLDPNQIATQSGENNFNYGTAEVNLGKKDSFNDEEDDEDVPALNRRNQELSKSDISQLSILQAAVTPQMKSRWENKSDISHLIPKTFNSNNRKVETSMNQDTTSAIEKSPFLQMKFQPYMMMMGANPSEYFNLLARRASVPSDRKEDMKIAFDLAPEAKQPEQILPFTNFKNESFEKDQSKDEQSPMALPQTRTGFFCTNEGNVPAIKKEPDMYNNSKEGEEMSQEPQSEHEEVKSQGEEEGEDK